MRKLLLILFALPLIAGAYVSPGQPAGFVNDFAGSLTTEQRQTLEEKLFNYEQATGNEIAVVIVPEMAEETVETYAVKLFEEWGIGKESSDNGALLLVAIKERQLRIEVGYGLEEYLTDIRSNQIISEVIIPRFAKNEIYEGILNGVDAMVSVIGGDVTGIGGQRAGFPMEIIFGMFWFAVVLIEVLVKMLSKSASWWAGGVVGGVLATMLGVVLTSLVLGLIAGAIFIPLGLLLDYWLSKSYVASRAKGVFPWWWFIGRGGKGGGSGFGGGFGGFGGGSSGGGGASGRW